MAPTEPFPGEHAHSVPGPTRARFAVRAVHGPPRPVLVLGVTGEVDRTNDAELVAAVRHVVDLTRSEVPRDRFGTGRVARAVVVDLRAATFVGARALGLLGSARDGTGARVRLVVPRDGVVRRALAVVGPPLGHHVHCDLAAAVLGEVDPTEHAVD